MVSEVDIQSLGLGNLPIDWEVHNADSICSKITKGTTPPKSEISEDNSIPFLRVNNLNFDGSIDTRIDTIFVSESAHNKILARSIAFPGDVLMNIVGPPLGKVALLDNTHPEYNMNQAIIIYRVSSPKVNNHYFFSYLKSTIAQQWLQSRSKKTSGQQNLTIELCKGLPVPVPPLAEQTKIAQILSTWDKAIAITGRLLANSQQQKQALAQNLLTGRKRHSEFSGTWKSYRLGDLFERITQKNTEGNTNVVTISAQHGLIRQDEFFKKTVASATLEGYYLLNQGQFAYNKSYSNGYPMGAIKRLNRYEKGVVTTLYICFAVRDKANCCPVFFEQFFDAGLLNEGLAQIAHEGGRAHGLLNVKPADFFSLKVQAPSLEEQQKIAQVLSTADAEIANLQAQLDKLKREKKALMQQLLTGKRRVRLDDEEEDVAPIRRVG